MTIEEENKMIEERMRKTLNTKYKCFTVEEFKSIRKDLDILEQYKSIEEKLGIDLITLIKVWNAVLQREYLWTKYNNELDETNDIEIGDDYNGLVFIYFYWDSGKHLTLYLKDYGKTWAFTKEELENDKNDKFTNYRINN